MNAQPQNIVELTEHHSAYEVAQIAMSLEEQNFNPHKWALLRKVQQVLKISDLFEVLKDHVTENLAIDGIHYLHEKENIAIETGNTVHHHVEYTLNLHGELLGIITFYRDQKFNRDELCILEEIICIFIYSLKNAVSYEKALQSAFIDAVTGINNRSAYEPTIKVEWELAKRQRSPLSLMTIDIDDFKHYNDSYGHRCGDYMLKSIAQLISNTIRDSDLLYRYGGDEFIIILRNTPIAGAMVLAERLRQAVNNCTLYYKQAPISATVSIGIACAHDCHHYLQLLEQADAALYRAKQDGKDIVSL